MDLNRLYNNPSMEARRLALLKRIQAEQVLRETHQGTSSLSRQIELGLQGRGKGTGLASWIAQCAAELAPRDRAAFRTLLLAVEERSAELLNERKHVGAMSRLARFSARWLRTPAGFFVRSYNADRQFSELARFLLADWPVPKLFDTAWSEGSPDAHREWFIHLGGGGNLRTAAGLPFPLTKMMAHHALRAPGGMPILSALRWGQMRALGGSERLAGAVAASLLREAQEDEPFWLSVLHFFAANPMLDPRLAGPILDWIRNQRFVAEPRRIVNGVMCGGGIPQPGLSMKGRTADSVMRQVERWHRDLSRATAGAALQWTSCGVPGYERVEGTEGSQTIVRIDELLAAADLIQEGRAMRHCVASYARSCSRGTSAIYSLKRDTGSGQERRLTIELDVRLKRIVQARGKHNAPPTALDQRFLRNWATVAGVAIGAF